ncbi:HEAT repeat protein [Geothermobacter ehrlichii]|uniref:HEAT repeat protein n=1 Tax=Geothermobacter ehrlichii TaxID=213224 RepID=A0A5D3WNN0_9BACT|nr:HEAT repeat domain-containing protein [Geothermobacter ehrlichii]TYP00135.1 HEAT repeat protein [Geothermobacter ehrlichii]
MTEINAQQLTELFASEREEERLRALRGLADLGVEKHLSLLYRAFGDESWRLRKEATDLFLAMPAAGELAGEIVELLHAHDNAGLRNTAVDILIRLGRQAVPRLLEELRCPDHDVRKFVLDILGAIGDPETGEAMIACLADADSNVRAAAAENLGRLKLVEAVPRLLAAMEEADLMFRFTILEALAQIGAEVPVERLLAYRDEPLLRKALFDCLGHVGNDAAVPVLLEGLSDPMSNVREAAAVALERIAGRNVEAVGACLGDGRDLGPLLAGLLESRNESVRRAAIRLLGWIGDEKTAAQLLELAREDAFTRDAVQALIAIANRSACALTRLWTEIDARSRAFLAYVLGEAGCEESRPLLLDALQQPVPELQQAAGHALGKVGGAEAPRALAGCLADCEPEIMDTLVRALISLAGRYPHEVVGAATVLFQAEDERIRTEAVNILAGINDGEIVPLVVMALKDESPSVRAAAVRACSGRDEGELWQALVLALTDEVGDVRRLAAEAIGGSGHPDACDALRLAVQDEDIWVRASAVRALGRIASEEALALVREKLADPVGLVVIAGLETLVEAAPQSAGEALVEALDHDDAEVVIAALKQLALSGCSDWVAGRGEALLNHGNWEVRLTAARTLVEVGAEQVASLLENRLLIEGEDLVRQQLVELLEALRAAREF